MSSRGQPSDQRPRVVVEADVDAVARAAAVHVRDAATAAVARRGRFRIALAGGSTPRVLYALLAGNAGAIDWGRTDVFFGDERAVGPNDPASNYRMARETLLARAKIPEGNVRRMRGEASDLDAAARAYEQALTGGAAPPLVDLALLGMGADGHTASLFPGTTALDERHRLCVAVEVPHLATQRLTLTYPVFLGAADVVFLVAGADKAPALRDVVDGPARPRERPAQVIARRAGPVTIYCDRAAASLLAAEAPRP